MKPLQQPLLHDIFNELPRGCKCSTSALATMQTWHSRQDSGHFYLGERGHYYFALTLSYFILDI